MHLTSFIHPARTFLPCSGVGRHMIGVLTCLQRRRGINLSLLFADQWLANGKLPAECPLRDLPFGAFPGNESWRERLWKLLGHPRLNTRFTEQADWIYCPMETRLPVGKTPWAITLHDVQPFEPGLPWSKNRAQRRNRRMWGLWLPQALKECRVVFTVSEFSKARMVELLGVPTEKIVVSGNGIDDAYFGSASSEIASAEPYVLLVGGLRREKGGLETLNVARRLKACCPHLRFLVVGEPNDPCLVAEAEALGNFRFLGRVPDEKMPGLLRGAVCLLFLSLYEGFGMPPLEAMACGTPVICSNCASLPEVVGEAAWLFDPDLSGDIAESIMELEANAALRTEWSAKGRAHASGITWERVAERVHHTLAERA